MDTRRLLIVAMLALAAFSAISKRGVSPGPEPDPGPQPVLVDTSDIAEQVHRSRAARQAGLYREAQSAVDAGQITNASDLGKYLVNGVAAIEADVAKPLSEDAAAKLPDGNFDDSTSVSKWLGDAASGFERVAR